MDDAAGVAPAPDDAAASGSAGSSMMPVVVRGLAQMEGRGAKAVRRSRRRPSNCNTRRRLGGRIAIVLQQAIDMYRAAIDGLPPLVHDNSGAPHAFGETQHGQNYVMT